MNWLIAVEKEVKKNTGVRTPNIQNSYLILKTKVIVPHSRFSNENGLKREYKNERSQCLPRTQVSSFGPYLLKSLFFSLSLEF